MGAADHRATYLIGIRYHDTVNLRPTPLPSPLRRDCAFSAVVLTYRGPFSRALVLSSIRRAAMASTAFPLWPTMRHQKWSASLMSGPVFGGRLAYPRYRKEPSLLHVNAASFDGPRGRAIEVGDGLAGVGARPHFAAPCGDQVGLPLQYQEDRRRAGLKLPLLAGVLLGGGATRQRRRVQPRLRS